jgi:hypothetical protein
MVEACAGHVSGRASSCARDGGDRPSGLPPEEHRPAAQLAGAVGSSIQFALSRWLNPHVTWRAFLKHEAEKSSIGDSAPKVREPVDLVFHFTWKYMRGLVLGLPVRVVTFGAGVPTSVCGPALCTSASFGPEADLLPAIALVVACARPWIRMCRISSHPG